ncbi:hypothetical protein RclHR1_11060003 [Rhizophagus clarus]|uniref:Uncharacterized protein n=1 Tax=Rhizophagus clarus TaxID=94130 RepID=A0A2Z6QUZ6_9GLOM|nr:hypothetical protein RclHR1_11060003 [Rhizophagus clarus]
MGFSFLYLERYIRTMTKIWKKHFLSMCPMLLSWEGQLDDIRQWYDGYRVGNYLYLYNPSSINSFIDDETLKAHWIDTGGTVPKIYYGDHDDFKDQVTKLI